MVSRHIDANENHYTILNKTGVEKQGVWEDVINKTPTADVIEVADGVRDAIITISSLPSAQQWIPCSERLPEEDYVLISKKPSKISGDKWCVAIAIRMTDPRSGKVNWRDTGFGVIQDDKVLAWMPLPEPYKGEES